MNNSTQLAFEKSSSSAHPCKPALGATLSAPVETLVLLFHTCELTEMAICLSYKSPNFRLLQAINRISIDLICPVRLREAPLLLVPFFASNSLFVPRKIAVFHVTSTFIF